MMMYSFRRWWERYGVQLVLIVGVLGGGWYLRQTQGAVLVELYSWISRPFHTQPISEEALVNARILELQGRLVELEQQNQKLQKLIDYSAEQPQPGIKAPVIGRSADDWWHHITLGRGSSQQVKAGDVVLGIGGLVGRVIAVTPNTSRVLLVSDPTSRVGVTISRSRAMGFMRGQDSDRAVIEFFDKVPDVKPGDRVATSAFSQLYPAGLPIGQIESVDLSRSPVPAAIVKLSAPIQNLEWAILYANNKPSAVLEIPNTNESTNRFDPDDTSNPPLLTDPSTP